MEENFKEAANYCLQILAHCQNSKKLKYSYIKCLLYGRDFVNAQKEITSLLKTSPVPELYYLRGLCLQYTGRTYIIYIYIYI